VHRLDVVILVVRGNRLQAVEERELDARRQELRRLEEEAAVV
jgi:hypothetical protein